MSNRFIEAIETNNSTELEVLLAGGLDINQEFLEGSQPTTPLYFAVSHDLVSIETIRLLLNAGADPNQYVEDRGTPVYAACEKGNAAALKLLLEHGGNVWPTRKFGRNFILSPEEIEERNKRERFVKPDEEVGVYDLQVPLFVAVQADCDECLKLIVSNGFSIYFSWRQKNVVTLATSPTMIEALANYGLIPSKTASEEDVLWRAMEDENLDLIRSIVNAFPIEKRQKFLDQKLAEAACFHTFKVVNFLVDLGANIQFVDEDADGFSNALTSACWTDYGAEPVFEGDYFDILKFLIDGGADVNLAGTGGMTPLHEAAYGDGGNATAVRMLLQHGAKVDVLNAEGDSPLHLACQRGEYYCVKLLLEAGANLNLTDSDGLTPLEVARRSLQWSEESYSENKEKYSFYREEQYYLRLLDQERQSVAILEQYTKSNSD